MTGIIVGIDTVGSQKNYRLVIYNKADSKCQYVKQLVKEEDLIKMLASKAIALDNATLVNMKIKGKTGDLSRFKANGFHPMVIISEIIAEGNLIGYRLASYEGKVSAIRLKDVLAYCARVQNNGAPIQNAIYVAESGGTKEHIRAYPDQVFHKETIQRNKSKVAQPAVVDKKNNQKQINSKLEDIFSPAQIKQLKLGKAHGVDIRVFGNAKLSADQMEEIRKALEDGINAKVFADPAFSASSMKALRINAKYGVDITYFINPKFNAEQIYELSTGYLSGVDISQYADPSMKAYDMSRKRIYLESKLWNEVEAEEK